MRIRGASISAVAAVLALAPWVQATPVVTDGLVAAYEFSGNTDDGSGNDYDAVNHDLDSAGSGAVLVADRFGNADSALRFDGGQWLSVSGFTTLASYTFSGWVSWDSVTGWRPFIDDTDGWSSDNVRFEIYNDQLSLSDTKSSSVGSLNANTWYQIGVTYDAASTAINFYFNGGLVSSIYSGKAAFDDYFEMGRGLYGWDEYLSGMMDDVYIYDRALSADEMGELYTPGPVPEPATMFLFGTGLAGLAGLRARRRGQ